MNDFRNILKKHKEGWIALTPDNKKVLANAKTLREVIREKMDVGGMGYAAYFKDSEGNILGLWENK